MSNNQLPHQSEPVCVDAYDAATAPAHAATQATDPGKYIHPDAAKMFAMVPCTKHIPLFTQSCEGMGPKATVALSACYFFNKGIGGYLVNYCRYAMFRTRFGIDGTRYQRLSTLRAMGWSVKALSACVSDTFALFGYTKRWYCAGSCVVGAAFALAFGLLPAKVESANTGAGFMFLACFCMANVDILSEGHYTRILRKRPACGPALVSWIWAFIFAAALCSAAIQGPLSDAGIPQVGLFISAGAQLSTVIFFILNWYGERLNKIERYEDVVLEAAEKKALLAEQSGASSDTEPTAADGDGAKSGAVVAAEAAVEYGAAGSGKTHPHPTQALSDELVLSHDAHGDGNGDDDAVDAEDIDHSAYIATCCCGVWEINKEVFARNWRLYVYAGIMVASVVVQCLVTVFGSSHDLGWSSLAVALVCCGTAFWACRLVAAKAIVFAFLDMLLYLQLPGVLDSFYMATPECYPDGPHFTYTFYNTVGAVIGDVGGVIGVTLFPYIFAKRSYWVTFVAVTTLQVTASIFDIIIVKRWNRDIGIPDHAMYILGDSIVFEIVYQCAWAPVVLLFSRICPRGSESIIYALASGFSNMGQSISSAIGSLFIELVWPIKTTGTCDFSNVPMLLLVAHILLPLAIIPASIILLPRARICDDIDQDGNPIVLTKENKGHAATAPAPVSAEFSESSENGCAAPAGHAHRQ